MTAPPDHDIETLFRIAQAIQGSFREARTSPHRADVVAMGADGSPTEAMDRVVEARLLHLLDEERVDWDVVSEEAGRIARGGGRTLVVDPIDGSHNVLRGIPNATVSLALGTGTLGGVDVGLIRDLYSGATYWAARGSGAFLDGRRIHGRRWEAKSELLCVNLGRHSTPRALALAGRARRVRSLGCASLEMSMVAAGASDAYLFENDTPTRNLRVTDIAAGYRIVREAGGFVGDADLRPLDEFPLDLDRRTSVCAWADPAFASAGPWTATG